MKDYLVGDKPVCAGDDDTKSWSPWACMSHLIELVVLGCWFVPSTCNFFLFLSHSYFSLKFSFHFKTKGTYPVNVQIGCFSFFLSHQLFPYLETYPVYTGQV